MSSRDEVPEVVGFRAGATGSTTGSATGSARFGAHSATTFAAVKRDLVEVRYRAGSYAERVASDVLRKVVKGRQDLRGFGSEPWGTPVVVWLTEPYAQDDGTLVDRGTVVDGATLQLWLIVTPDQPVESPHRALALVFGAALPGAEQNGSLVEAYGMHLAGAECVAQDERLNTEREFVDYLIKREGDEAVRRLLAAAPDRLQALSRELFGASLPQLRQAFAASRHDTSGGRVRLREFVRMSARFVWPYRFRQLELFLHMMLGLSFTLAFPLVTQRMFDSALPSGRMSEVTTLLLVLGAAFVVSLAADVRRAYLQAWIGGAVSRDLRQQLFDRMQVVHSRWHRQHDQGDLLTRLFADVSQVQGGLTEVISTGIFQAISVTVSTAVMLSINVTLGIVVLIGVPVIAFVFTVLAGGAVKRSKDVQANQASLMSVAAENSRAGSVVRLFGLAGFEGRRFRQQADRFFTAQKRMSQWMGMFALSINLVLRLLRLVVLGFGGWLILQGQFTTGGLVAFLAIMGEVLNPITDLANVGQAIQGSMGSLLRINEVLATDPESASGPSDDSGAGPAVSATIELRGVSFGYGPDARALDGVSCTIQAGTRVAFVGPSGSGKSTVMHLLMRLDDPDEGAIVVDGRDLREYSVGSWRRQLGVVFQDSFLFNATIRENVALGSATATEADVGDAAARAEVETFARTLPDGLDSPVGEGGSSLSGGQRQRIAIARALVRRPRVLLLDEATSALDPGTERQINDTLAAVADGCTVIAVTHRLTSITDYDEIFVIDAGKLVEHGAHDELVARQGLYAALWAEQSGQPTPVREALDVAEVLAELPLFDGLDASELSEVEALMTRHALSAGDHFVSQQALLVVASGRVNARTDTATLCGHSVELRVGDVAGLASVMGANSTTEVHAVTDVRLLRLDLAAIEALAARYPGVGEARTGRTVQFHPVGRTLGPLVATPSSQRSVEHDTPRLAALRSIGVSSGRAGSSDGREPA